MIETQINSFNELHVELLNPEKEVYNINDANKKKLNEIIKRVFIGNNEDSKNILLLNGSNITHIIIIRYSKEDYSARANFPHNFEYYIIDLNNEFEFTGFSLFKYLLDETLFENNKNKVFIQSYSIKNALCLLTFYITTILNYEIEDVISYIKKITNDFFISVEETDQIYYFIEKHKLTYYPGEYASYLSAKDRKDENRHS